MLTIIVDSSPAMFNSRGQPRGRRSTDCETRDGEKREEKKTQTQAASIPGNIVMDNHLRGGQLENRVRV